MVVVSGIKFGGLERFFEAVRRAWISGREGWTGNYIRAWRR